MIKLSLYAAALNIGIIYMYKKYIL